MADERRRTLAEQRRREVSTHVYLYRTGDQPEKAEVWRADLVDVAEDETQTDRRRRPAAFQERPSFVYLELGRFQPVPPGWVLDHLELYDFPGRQVDKGALGNQVTPVYVIEV